MVSGKAAKVNPYQVAKLLDKLRVAFTKSRPRHSNDNGLAETKACSLRPSPMPSSLSDFPREAR